MAAAAASAVVAAVTVPAAMAAGAARFVVAAAAACSATIVASMATRKTGAISWATAGTAAAARMRAAGAAVAPPVVVEAERAPAVARAAEAPRPPEETMTRVMADLTRWGLAPTRVVAPWLLADPEVCRPKFDVDVPVSDLKRRPIVEVMQRFGTRGVLSTTAAHEQATVRAFWRHIGAHERAARWDVDEAICHYLTSVFQRPAVTRFSTIEWHMRVLQHLYGDRRAESAVVKAWFEGLAMQMPVAARQAGVEVARTVDVTGFERWVDEQVERAATSRLAALVLEFAACVMWGMRPSETVRTMARRAPVVVARAGGRVTFRVMPVGLKDDKMQKVVAPRPRFVTVHDEWANVVASLAPAQRLRQTEQQWLFDKAVPMLRRYATDMRAYRRAAAEATRQAATDQRVVEVASRAQQAIETVRDVLGHAPGSRSTMSYVAEAFGLEQQQLMVELAGKRSAAMGLAKRG